MRRQCCGIQLDFLLPCRERPRDLSGAPAATLLGSLALVLGTCLPHLWAAAPTTSPQARPSEDRHASFLGFCPVYSHSPFTPPPRRQSPHSAFLPPLSEETPATPSHGTYSFLMALHSWQFCFFFFFFVIPDHLPSLTLSLMGRRTTFILLAVVPPTHSSVSGPYPVLKKCLLNE